MIPAGAVTDRSLEARDLQVLCLLGRHTDKAGWCVRSQVKMAQEIDCSRGSLQNSLDRLTTAGWIEKKRRDLEVDLRRGGASGEAWGCDLSYDYVKINADYASMIVQRPDGALFHTADVPLVDALVSKLQTLYDLQPI